MVPMRVIFEALGAEVSWDEETQMVQGTKDGIVVQLQIGSTLMFKNGNEILLDVPPQIMDDRTLVPVRAVAEDFDANVQWDANSNTVIITSDPMVPEILDIPPAFLP